MSLVLDAAQLSRVFGKGENAFTAVDRVSLRVSSGEIHALLGPNGAGKTTTVQMCSTLLTPTGGNLTVNGIDAIAHPQRARRHVGLALGGENGFYPRASARDNLLFFADVAGVSGRTRRHEVEHALARVELADAATRPVQEFSRGMKQRLHIARALLGSPALLLLDEPTNGLDPDIALTVRTLIRSLAEDGAAILLTSHLLGEIEDLAHTITVLGAGSVAVSGSLEDIAAHAGIAATTVVQVEATATEGIDTLRGFLGDKAAVLFAPRGSGWELTLYWHGERATFEAGEAHRILAEGLAASRIGARTEPYTRPATLEEFQRQGRRYDLWQECARQLRLMGFSLRQFLTVPYFIQLLISTVLGSVILQALAVHAAAQSSAGHSVDPTLAWTRAGIVGMWSVCIVSAGIINFERFRGTLVYLCSGSISPVRVLAAIVSSASIVGMAALPLSWLIWALVTLNPQVTDFSALWPRYVLGVPLLWLACLSVTFMIAVFFVATPNAIAYEELLLVPVFILSGVLFTTIEAPAWLDAAGVLIPLQAPVHLLLGRTAITTPADALLPVIQTLVVSFIWALCAFLFARKALASARRRGTLGAM